MSGEGTSQTEEVVEPPRRPHGYRIRYKDVAAILPKPKKIVFGLRGTEADNEEISFEEVFMVYKKIEGRLHGLKKSISDMQELAVGVLSPQREPVLRDPARDDSEDSDVYEDSREYTLEEFIRLTTPTDEDIARAEEAEKAEKAEEERRKRTKPKRKKRLTRKEFYAMVQETERAEQRVHIQMDAVRDMMSRFPDRLVRAIIKYKKYLFFPFQV